jgi:hypothetical protein
MEIKMKASLLAAAAIAVVATTHSVSAGSGDPSSLPSLPPATTAAATAARVVSEAPYQRVALLTCNSANTTCFTRFPPVPAGSRLVVQFVSCIADGAVDTTFQHFGVLVADATLTKRLAHHFFGPTYRSPAPPYHYVASQPMVLAAAAGSVVFVEARSMGSVLNVECGVSGVMQKLG